VYFSVLLLVASVFLSTHSGSQCIFSAHKIHWYLFLTKTVFQFPDIAPGHREKYHCFLNRQKPCGPTTMRCENVWTMLVVKTNAPWALIRKLQCVWFPAWWSMLFWPNVFFNLFPWISIQRHGRVFGWLRTTLFQHRNSIGTKDCSSEENKSSKTLVSERQWVWRS